MVVCLFLGGSPGINQKANMVVCLFLGGSPGISRLSSLLRPLFLILLHLLHPSPGHSSHPHTMLIAFFLLRASLLLSLVISRAQGHQPSFLSSLRLQKKRCVINTSRNRVPMEPTPPQKPRTPPNI